jgi:ferredoxin
MTTEYEIAAIENPTLFDPASGEELGWQEDGLFVRDLEGHLIRYDKPTHEELEKRVELTIDDTVIKVLKAVPATDEMGEPLYEDGRIRPRATTIYDAVSQLYEKRAKAAALDAQKSEARGEEGSTNGENFKRSAGDLVNPVPILCHMKYMQPVAVCRVCVVQIARFKRSANRIEVDPKLVPACQHRVEEGMIVHTIASPNLEARARVERAVKTLLMLLMADHPTPCAKERQTEGDCELEALGRRFGVDKSPFESRPHDRPKDETSLVIAVDHNACIMCDRCVRGCDVIKENHVIGRMNKGYKARIAFDLDATMGRSTCVACGECMVSCPTGALTFKDTIAANWPDEEGAGRASSSPRRWRGWANLLSFGLINHRAARPLDRNRRGATSRDNGRAQS